jgi:hypothetical protein
VVESLRQFMIHDKQFLIQGQQWSSRMQQCLIHELCQLSFSHHSIGKQCCLKVFGFHQLVHL